MALEAVLLAQIHFEREKGNLRGAELLEAQLNMVQALVRAGMITELSVDQFAAFQEAATVTNYPVEVSVEPAVRTTGRRGRKAQTVDPTSFGGQLRILRGDKSVTEIAILAFGNPGDRSYLSKVETGAIKHPSQDRMNQLAGVLGVVIDVSSQRIIKSPTQQR